MATELKTYIPDWVTELLSDHGSISNQAKAYKRVPLVYRAFRIRCNSLASVPIHVHNKGGEDIPWPFRTPINKIVWDMEASQLIDGASFVVFNQGSITGNRRDLQVLNPFAVTVNSDKLPPTFTYQGLFGQTTFPYDEILYLPEYNPDDDIHPGPGAVEVALNDARLLYYLSRFPETFFSSGAMPVTILGVKTNNTGEVEKVENWFRQRMRGIQNAFGILGVKADTITAQTITPDLKDMSMPELKVQAREGVADAFELSASYLDDTANFATASQKDQSLWEQVIMPRAKRIEASLNIFMEPMNVSIQFAFEELKAFQEDENNRAASLSQLTTAGVPLTMALDILGYDLTDEQRAQLEATTQPVPAAPTPAMTPAAEPAPVPPGKSLREVLQSWKVLSLAAAKEGWPMPIEFDDPIIPDDMAEFLRYELETCGSESDVHRVFRKARADYKPIDLAKEMQAARLLLERVIDK